MAARNDDRWRWIAFSQMISLIELGRRYGPITPTTLAVNNSKTEVNFKIYLVVIRSSKSSGLSHAQSFFDTPVWNQRISQTSGRSRKLPGRFSGSQGWQLRSLRYSSRTI